MIYLSKLDYYAAPPYTDLSLPLHFLESQGYAFISTGSVYVVWFVVIDYPLL